MNNEEILLGSRAPLERMQVILGLLRKNVYPNASTIATLLETSTKTVHRDIEFLRDRLMLDIRYDGSRFGYWLADGPHFCPFCNPEVRMAFVGRHVGSRGHGVDESLVYHARARRLNQWEVHHD